jgi:hypothetical protein
VVIYLPGSDCNCSIYCGTLRLDESIEGETSMVNAKQESQNKKERKKLIP